MALEQALLHLPPVLDKTVASEYSSKPRSLVFGDRSMDCYMSASWYL